MKRREFFKTAGIGSVSLVTISTLADALVTPALASPSLDGSPANKFTILLAGPYKPVVRCPDLGLSTVNVCNGTFTTTKIYPVSGLPLDDDGDNQGNGPSDPHHGSAIGRFYAPSKSKICAYELPGGTIAMMFLGINTLMSVPDSTGGTYQVGTIDLSITEATGVYASFVGGHNKMVDILHHLADGTAVEDCFCNISHP